MRQIHLQFGPVRVKHHVSGAVDVAVVNVVIRWSKTQTTVHAQQTIAVDISVVPQAVVSCRQWCVSLYQQQNKIQLVECSGCSCHSVTGSRRALPTTHYHA